MILLKGKFYLTKAAVILFTGKVTFQYEQLHIVVFATLPFFIIFFHKADNFY